MWSDLQTRKPQTTTDDLLPFMKASVRLQLPTEVHAYWFKLWIKPPALLPLILAKEQSMALNNHRSWKDCFSPLCQSYDWVDALYHKKMEGLVSDSSSTSETGKRKQSPCCKSPLTQVFFLHIETPEHTHTQSAHTACLLTCRRRFAQCTRTVPEPNRLPNPTGVKRQTQHR